MNYSEEKGEQQLMNSVPRLAIGTNRRFINRDANAYVNMAQIVRSLLDFGYIPGEFRRDNTVLRKDLETMRSYSYSAKRMNRHGQITKFKRMRKRNKRKKRK